MKTDRQQQQKERTETNHTKKPKEKQRRNLPVRNEDEGKAADETAAGAFDLTTERGKTHGPTLRSRRLRAQIFPTSCQKKCNETSREVRAPSCKTPNPSTPTSRGLKSQQWQHTRGLSEYRVEYLVCIV